MPKVYNNRDRNVPADAVYVGRPSKWGNPFKVGDWVHRPAGSRQLQRGECIDLYRNTLPPALIDAAKRELKGKDLVCWCAPEPCHADVLLEIANAD